MKEKRRNVHDKVIVPWKYTSTSCHYPRVVVIIIIIIIRSIYVSSIDRTKNVEYVLLCTKKKTVLRRGGGGGGGGL